MVDKEMEMECKINEKSMAKMLENGKMDDDLGIVVPTIVPNKDATDNKIQEAKDALAEMKLAYLIPSIPDCQPPYILMNVLHRGRVLDQEACQDYVYILAYPQDKPLSPY